MTRRSRWLALTLLALFPLRSGAHLLCVETSPSDADVTVHGDLNDMLTYTDVLAKGDVLGGSEDELLFGQGSSVHVVPGPHSPNLWDISSLPNHLIIDISAYGCWASAVAVGNVNGDAYKDILVGTYGNGACGAGRVFVFLGPFPDVTLATRILYPSDAALEIHYSVDNERLTIFGALATGDVTGDGVDDLLIGDAYADRPPGFRAAGLPGDVNSGAAYVVCGDTSWVPPPGPGTPIQLYLARAEDAGTSGAQSFTVIGAAGGNGETGAGGDSCGALVHAGDVDVDGNMDFIVGVPDRQLPPTGWSGPSLGQVWVFYGPLAPNGCGHVVIDLKDPATYASIPHLVYEEQPGHERSRFGLEVNVVETYGSRADVVIGAPEDSAPLPGVTRVHAGRVGLFATVATPPFMPRDSSMLGTWGSPETITIAGGSAGALFGRAIDVGLLNGDPVDDVVVGSPGANQAWVFCKLVHGQDPIDCADAWLEQPGCPDWPTDFTVITGSAEDLGNTVAIGNFGGDASPDLAVGAMGYDAGFGQNGGAVYAFFGGSPCRFCNEPPETYPPAQPNFELGCTANDQHQVVLIAGAAYDCDDVDNPLLGGLTYHWELDPLATQGCTNARFGTDDNPTQATFSFDVTDSCTASCVVNLTITDCRHGSTSPPGCDDAPTYTFRVDVLDDIAPELSGCPADLTQRCDQALPPLANVTATDECDPAPVLEFTETIEPEGCDDRYAIVREWLARDRCGNVATCSQRITVTDDVPPTFSEYPLDDSVSCSSVPSPPVLTASDDCDPAPTVSYAETRTDTDCVDAYTLERRWTATDRCSNSASWTQILTVTNAPPALSGHPINETVECDQVPSPPAITATDDCGPNPLVDFVENRTDGRCADFYVLHRTWTATDRCGARDTWTQDVSVEDRIAPTLSAHPADETVECNGVPPPPTITAADICDPDPSVAFVEIRIDGSCAQEYELIRTWTATDRCGNASSFTQHVSVVDTQAPVLSWGTPGCLSDIAVDCSAVPVAVQPTVSDCDPSPSVTYTETRIDGLCAGNYVLRRQWVATDQCGHSSACTQNVTVTDTTAPTITESHEIRECLWPPNHQYVGFGTDSFSPVIQDDCSEPVTWTFAACISSQADNANGVGDGNTVDDCTVTATTVRARAERYGTDPDGRSYTVYATAVDGCNNASGPIAIGVIHVPHDMRNRVERSCTSAND